MTRILLFFSFCCIISFNVSAACIIAVDNEGDWAESSSWNLNRIPANGDFVVIPSGITVTVTSNNYNSVPTRPTLDVEVRGTLLFIGGSGQLNLECASTVYTRDGGIIPSTGCNCNQIAIGLGEAAWKGSYPSITNGNSVVNTCNNNLPVNILSFTAVSEAQGVLLEWNTTSEIDFSHFEIERSADAIHFNALSSLSSVGNHYQFNDAQPLNGTAYYRLKAVDLDGTFKYSAVVSVEYESTIKFDVYPNPATNGMINLILSEGQSTVVMKDIMGKSVEINVQPKDDHLYSLEYPTSLSPGIYILTVTQFAGQYSKTIIVQ